MCCFHRSMCRNKMQLAAHSKIFFVASCAFLEIPDEGNQVQPTEMQLSSEAPDAIGWFWSAYCCKDHPSIMATALGHGQSHAPRQRFPVASTAVQNGPHVFEWWCRVTLNQASVSLNADAIMTAVRDFMERSARETSAKEEASGRRVSSHMPHMQTCGLYFMPLCAMILVVWWELVKSVCASECGVLSALVQTETWSWQQLR